MAHAMKKTKASKGHRQIMDDSAGKGVVVVGKAMQISRTQAF